MITTHPAIVVLSGGQDSTTCLLLACKDYARVHAITFDYHQRHRIEIEAARIVASMCNIASHEIIELPKNVLASTSPLTNATYAVEQYDNADALPGGIEKTFVPLRNQLFLTLAANRAIAHANEMRNRHAVVITGISQEDYGGYPDCRENFLRALQNTIDLAIGSEDTGYRITLLAPLMHLNKHKIVRVSERMNARDILAFSHTCYRGASPPCMHCHACLLRARGYAQAGVTDPLLDRIGVAT